MALVERRKPRFRGYRKLLRPQGILGLFMSCKAASLLDHSGRLRCSVNCQRMLAPGGRGWLAASAADA